MAAPEHFEEDKKKRYSQHNYYHQKKHPTALEGGGKSSRSSNDDVVITPTTTTNSSRTHRHHRRFNSVSNSDSSGRKRKSSSNRSEGGGSSIRATKNNINIMQKYNADDGLYICLEYNKINNIGNYVRLLINKRLDLSTSSSRATLRKFVHLFNSNFILFFLIILLNGGGCSGGGVATASRQEASTSCTFPQRWEGTWFQSGLHQPIHIKGSSLSFRGKCIATDGGDKFLMVDDNGCHRCLVIYEKHKNVLQYKESECEDMYMDQSNPAAMPIQQNMRSILKSQEHRGGAHPNTNGHSRISSSDQFLNSRSNDDTNDYFCRGRETLQHLCEQIPGDALLFSMFKVDAEPVKCPLKGPFTFTYNRGHGECRSPVSNIESCTEDSRLLLSFQACPDVSGTESTIEELTCLATWKDGNARYLIALVNALNQHHHSITNEDRYRCFVYEKVPAGSGGSFKDAEYKLAQSGDATCNGLDSAEVGSRIMTLRKAPPAERCDFPSWFKGPKHWHALMGNAGYTFHQSDGSMHITKQSGQMETRALCEQINKQTESEMQAVVHYTTRCQSGFMCMQFYRRYTHVAELQIGTPAIRLEDACARDHFDVNNLPYVTLLASNPESDACPLEGLYNIKGAIGPPVVTTRHKRNHVNRSHNHTHHHDVGYRRHVTLSFRNAEDTDKNSWHGLNRGITTRNRRSSLKEDEIVIEDEIIIDDGLKKNLRKSLVLDSNKSNSNSRRTKRDASGCTVNYNSNRQLFIGCSQQNVIEVRPSCNSEDGDEVYTCHGTWTDNQTVFVIAKHAGTQHGVCLSYRSNAGNQGAQLFIGDGCFRKKNHQPPEHYLVANLTTVGKCSDTSSSNSITEYQSFLSLFILFVSTSLFIISGR